ncbi:MAG: hypothetical protein IKZ07_05935 [Akkermansia sp.]|nr:hypothetical protein [Akkermansia sp.]
MNQEFLGVEYNMTVLAGSRPEYELEFKRGQDKVSVENVTFFGVITWPDGMAHQTVSVQHTSSNNVLLVQFPVLEGTGDYIYEIGYATSDGSCYRLMHGRLGVLTTAMVTAKMAALPQSVRRMSVLLPEVVGGRIEIGWVATNAALHAAQEVLGKLTETQEVLGKANQLHEQAKDMLAGAKNAILHRYIASSFSALPKEGHGNAQYLVPNGSGGWDVYIWAIIGSYGGWFKVGTAADITLLQADSVTSGAVRLAGDMSDDSGVTTAKQVREYVQSGAGYVTADALEPLAKTADVEKRMKTLHANVLTADNATQFVEISRAQFEALQAKPNNVYYLIYES